VKPSVKALCFWLEGRALGLLAPPNPRADDGIIFAGCFPHHLGWAHSGAHSASPWRPGRSDPLLPRLSQHLKRAPSLQLEHLDQLARLAAWLSISRRSSNRSPSSTRASSSDQLLACIASLSRSHRPDPASGATMAGGVESAHGPGGAETQRGGVKACAIGSWIRSIAGHKQARSPQSCTGQRQAPARPRGLQALGLRL